MAQKLALAVALLALAAVSLAQQGAWKSAGAADSNEVIQFHLALKRTDAAVAALNKKFTEVSDPAHADYGNYWTREQLAQHITVEQSAFDAVLNHAKNSKMQVGNVGICKDVITLKGRVEDVAAFLQVRLESFTHPASTSRIIRTLDAPSFPEGVLEHVEAVYGLHAFPVVREDLTIDGVPGIVTPQVIRKLYGVSDVFSGSSKASQALAEFQFQGYRVEDLTAFQTKYSLPNQPVRNVTGAGQTVVGHTEANLDVQYIMVTGQKIPTDFWVQKGNEFDLLAWAQYVESDSNAALVWSVSYGEDIDTIVSTFGAAYVTRFNDEVMKLGTLGITVLFASGDSGVYSRQGNLKVFHPDFPASLPAVTAVGATQLNLNNTETTVVSFSGGGFTYSKYFPRNTSCAYQTQAASTFFSTSTKLPPANMYDAAGCGYPDVSALGVNFEVVINGVTEPVSGTSAACPTVAGIIALLNDQRMSAGRPPLGFVNPLLYANPSAFHDIADGVNRGSGPYGFTAIKGWDPASGLGTPNYQALKNIV